MWERHLWKRKRKEKSYDRNKCFGPDIHSTGRGISLESAHTHTRTQRNWCHEPPPVRHPWTVHDHSDLPVVKRGGKKARNQNIYNLMKEKRQDASYHNFLPSSWQDYHPVDKWTYKRLLCNSAKPWHGARPLSSHDVCMYKRKNFGLVIKSLLLLMRTITHNPKKWIHNL